MGAPQSASDPTSAPKNDEFHDKHGNHRKDTDPPPGFEGARIASWRRNLRLHIEGHGHDAWVATLLGKNGEGEA